MAESNRAVEVTQEPELVLPDKFVRFVGTNCTTRVIYTSDWPVTVAKPPTEDLVWNDRNGWTVPLKGLSKDVLQVLRDDGNFVICD